MARLRYNLLESTLSADINAAVTTIPLALPLQEGGVNVPTFSAPDTLALRIGTEIMEATAYTAGATTITVVRGQEDTVAEEHFAGDEVKNVITKEDFQSSGGGTFSITIAASDSSDTDKDRADYVCTGTGDQSIIQAAIALITAETNPAGVIEFATGNYNVSAGITVPSSSIITFLGPTWIDTWYDEDQGAVINRTGASNYPLLSLTNSRVALEKMFVYDAADDANTSSLITMAGSRLDVLNSSVVTYQNAAIQVTSGSDLYIYESYVEADTAAIYCNDTALTSFDVWVSDSNLWGWPWSVNLTCGGACEFTFNNVETTPIRIDGNVSNTPKPDVLIQGGKIYAGTDESLYLTDLDALLLSNVKFGGGGGSAASAVRLGNIDTGVVNGNMIGDFLNGVDHHGIWMLDCENVLVEGNTIYNCSLATDNTYSGIILDGDTNNCTIQNNKISTDGAGNLPLYGIRIDDSTCDNNYVKNNDLSGSCKTNGNQISDAGTGTRGHDVLMFALSDETNIITTTGQKLSVRWPFNFCLGKLRASLNTASASGGPFTIDVNDGGASVMTTNLLIIDDTQLTSLTATQPNITDRYLAEDAIITFDVDDVGDGAATGAKVSVYGWRI